MTHTFKLARRAARFRAPLLLTLLAFTFGGCDSADRLTDTSADELTDPVALADPAADADARLEDSLAVEDSLAFANGDPTGGRPMDDLEPGLDEAEQAEAEVASSDPAAATSVAPGLSMVNAFRGGIPFGTYHLPREQYGKYNGAISNISANLLISYLETARRTGTRIVLSFTGSDKMYRNSDGSFSLTKWKARVNRYRGLNLTPYVKDGTIIAHYLLDEPHVAWRWRGKVVSRATIDEMARYSKQLWPTLTTVVRTKAAYLKGYNYRYLDATWSQYAARFGSASAWLSKDVRDAKAMGLGLFTGMNHLAGGSSRGLKGYYPGMFAMSASELRSLGGALLAEPYVCAMINWKFDAKYMARSDVKAALAYLAGRARSRPTRSCGGGKVVANNPPPPPPSSPGGSAGGGGSSGGGSAGIVLRVSGRQQGRLQHMTLTWSGISGANVDVYRNGVRVKRTPNDRRYMNSLRTRPRVSYVYKVCRTGSSTCSKSVRVSFR